MKRKRKINTLKLLKSEWRWDHQKWENGERIRGVTIKGRKLRWWSETYPGYAGGFSCTQDIEDFLLPGPKVDGVPDEIVKKIKETIDIVQT